MASIDLGLPEIVDLLQCQKCHKVYTDGEQMTTYAQNGVSMEACPNCYHHTSDEDVVAQVFRKGY